jgi:hypothetical protein
MKKVVLIHGFGIGRDAPVLFRRLEEDGGFSVFKDMLAYENAKVFYWDIQVKMNLLQVINPWEVKRLYDQERVQAAAPATLLSLHEFISQEKPDTLFCHSMGCYLLDNYLKTYDLPNFVKHIIFIQGDIQNNFIEENTKIQTLLASKKTTFTNLYCPWDYTLWCSLLYNRYLPVGLSRIKNPSITNIFFPVHPWLAHTNGIRKSKKLIKVLGKD